MTDPPKVWSGNRSRISDEVRRVAYQARATLRRSDRASASVCLHQWAVLSVFAAAGALALVIGSAGFVSAPSTTAPVPEFDLIGRAVVMDGDTIEIDGQRILLHGIDAPEAAQRCAHKGDGYPCGQAAAFVLADRIGRQTVACEAKDTDRSGRIRAVCMAGGEDLNAFMVRNGWALAHRTASPEYADEEAAAEDERLGLWRGDFLPPWHWRRGRRMEQHAAATPGDCRIKGNISRRGERVYYLPYGQRYDRAKINEAKGERWFCSEADARAAGWRPFRD